ncbi:MAG TPA: PAS domain S-box protein, partial [Pyrinomonadaceae bacterium]
ESISGWVAREREPLMLEGKIKDPRFRSLWPHPEIRSSISIPMQVANKLVGTININALDRPRPFTLGQMKAVTILASTAAAALESASLYRQVQQAEEKYRSIFENAIGGVFQSTPEGRLLTANPAMARILGYDSPEEVIEKITDVIHQLYVHPEDLARAAQLQEEGGVLHGFEFEAYRKDREKICLSLNRRSVCDENGIELYREGSVEDITERKRAEELLRQSEILNRSLVEHLPHRVFVKDRNCAYLFCNSNYALDLGIGPKQIVGEDDFAFFPPALAEGYRADDREVMAAGKTKDIEERYELAGAERWIHTIKVPYRNEQGDIIGVLGLFEDITERKLAEAQRELLSALVEASPDFIAYADPKTTQIQYINKHGRRMCGIEEDEDVTKLKISDVHPAWMNKRLADVVLPEAVRDGLWEGDGAFLHRDGREIPVSMVLLARKAANGEVDLFYTVSRDITERKRTDDALRESEERYRDLVENAQDIIYSHNLRGNYTSTNKAGEQITGYTREESLKLNFVDTVAPEYVKTARQMLARKLAGETTTVYELELIAKDGHRIPVEVNTRLVLRDGVPVGVQGIARDVTDRKRTEADLLRLAAAVEQTADSVVITDPKGNILYVNPAFERITGYAKEEVLDQSSRILKSGKTDPAIYKELWEAITRGEVWVGQLTNRKKDGTLFEERVTISPVHDKNDRIVNYIAVKQDISDFIKLEDQLRQSQKMEAIGQLAGGVAHDFNNLLTAINGYSGLALQKMDDNHPLRGYLEEIKKAGDRAASLTRQLLAFGRKQILQPLPISLNDVVTDMNKMLRRLIGEDIVLIAKLDPGLKKIKADPGQIEQVLVNLIVNARDAMPQGGKLTIETLGVDLDQEYAGRHVGVVPGRYVMLAVSDTGTGMSEDTRARIFDPFFTTKEKGKGTGLGLSTVYGIVKQSGGNIWVYSELGHGTTFKVYLPELAAAPQKTEAAAVESLMPGGSETILLVEDEDVVRGLARKTLEHAGYHVLEASRSEEAVRLFHQQAQPIDLLLTDVVMPETSGKEVADRLTELLPGLRVLFMSGYTDEAIVHHGVLDSDVEFIQKPFTPAALVRKVRAVLDSELVISDSVSLLPKGEGEIEVEHEHHDA